MVKFPAALSPGGNMTGSVAQDIILRHGINNCTLALI
jgi:hypothetical protein